MGSNDHSEYVRQLVRRQAAGRTIRADLNNLMREIPPWERADLARFGEQEPPVGTVLRWTDKAGTHVALRADDGQWAITNDSRGGWRAVAERIGDAECHVALTWREIPRPEPEPAGDEAVRDWAAQFIPESPSAPVEDEDGVI